jgi:hypothetical protein
MRTLKILRGSGANMTRKRVKAIPVTIGNRAKVNYNRSIQQPMIANRITYPLRSVSIRNMPTYESTAKVLQPQKPKILNQPHKFSMTKRFNMPRVRGSRNIFKSIEEKKNFKKLLKNIYGNRSENVYNYWETHKNNLTNTLRNSEIQSRRSFNSNNTNETNIMLNNLENPEFYKEIMDLYGKNFAEFQNYRMRAKRQGMSDPFNFNTTRRIRNP